MQKKLSSNFACKSNCNQFIEYLAFGEYLIEFSIYLCNQIRQETHQQNNCFSISKKQILKRQPISKSMKCSKHNARDE